MAHNCIIAGGGAVQVYMAPTRWPALSVSVVLAMMLVLEAMLHPVSLPDPDLTYNTVRNEAQSTAQFSHIH